MKQKIEKAKKFVKKHKWSILVGLGTVSLIIIGLTNSKSRNGLQYPSSSDEDLNKALAKIGGPLEKIIKAEQDCDWTSLGYKVGEPGFKVSDLGKYGELLLECDDLDGITADSELTAVYLVGKK